MTTAKINDGAITKDKIATAAILDLVYPIGSIYMSVNSTDPKNLFGGTWAQLKDTFLIAHGDTYTSTKSATPTQVAAEAGSTSYTPAGSVGSHTLTISEMPSHSHRLVREGSGTDWAFYKIGSSGNASSVTLYYPEGQAVASTGGGGGHNHGFTGTAATIIPPYLTVYMWKRTA